MAIEKEYQYYRYHYVPKNVVLSLGDESFQFRDSTITYMNLMFDFVNNRLPVIQCGIECTTLIIAKIYQHKDIAKMTITIDEERRDSDNNLLDNKPYLNKTFDLVPSLDQNCYINSPNLEIDERTDYAKMLQMFEFYLVDLEKVNYFNSKCNFSVTNTTFPAMLQSLFIARNIAGKNVVASPPYDDSVFLKKVVLPLNTLIGNIKTLNVKYGLYDCNPIIFWDFNYLYCLNKRNPDITMEDSATDYGTVTFTVYNPDDDHHMIHGSYDDQETNTHYVNLENPPGIQDDTYHDDHTKTTNIITVDKDGNIVADKADSKTNSNATKATYIYAENKLSKTQVENEMLTGPTVNIIAMESSIRFLKPYKDYNFQMGNAYENLKLEGKTFRLLQYSLAITREGSTNFLNDVSMVLYCPEREPEEPDITPDPTVPK